MNNTESSILNIGDHIQASLNVCHPLFAERSAPLFAIDDRGRPDLYATCVAVRAKSRVFLLTAAHAINEIKKTDSAVHVGGKNIIVIPGEFVRTSKDGSDPLDVAAIEVSEAFLADNQITVVEYQETTCNREFARPHMHCMHGYPLTKNKPIKSLDVGRKVVKTYAFTYAGVVVSNPDFHNAHRTPKSHAALSYQLGKNENGVKVNPPKPKGMSGGGLWLIPNSFNSNQIYLGGILIEQHDQTVLATRIEHALRFALDNA